MSIGTVVELSHARPGLAMAMRNALRLDRPAEPAPARVSSLRR
jgi:hypothetical protein